MKGIEKSNHWLNFEPFPDERFTVFKTSNFFPLSTFIDDRGEWVYCAPTTRNLEVLDRQGFFGKLFRCKRLPRPTAIAESLHPYEDAVYDWGGRIVLGVVNRKVEVVELYAHVDDPTPISPSLFIQKCAELGLPHGEVVGTHCQFPENVFQAKRGVDDSILLWKSEYRNGVKFWIS